MSASLFGLSMDYEVVVNIGELRETRGRRLGAPAMIAPATGEATFELDDALVPKLKPSYRPYPAAAAAGRGPA